MTGVSREDAGDWASGEVSGQIGENGVLHRRLLQREMVTVRSLKRIWRRDGLLQLCDVAQVMRARRMRAGGVHLLES